MKRLKRVIASGTFDRLHQGHKQFLETAFAAAERVDCFLTDYEDYRQCPEKKLPEIIDDYQRRLRDLQAFLQERDYRGRAKVFRLDDCFGPTLENNDYDGLVVSQETLMTAEVINKKRKERDLNPLEVILAGTVKDSQEKMLSSSNIRLGRVNRKGKNFGDLLPQKRLFLPQSQRQHFKRPLGQLLVGSKSHLGWAALQAGSVVKKMKTPYIITVGDIATQAFINNGISFDLAIIDQKTRREKYYYLNRSLLKVRQVFKAENPAGTISPSLTTALTRIFSQGVERERSRIVNLNRSWIGKAVLLIEGEEDLAVLPCMLLAPLESLIFYGQPFEGLVKIKVTEEVKDQAVELLRKFVS